MGTIAVYYLFDFKDEQKQDPNMMLRSLYCQLARQHMIRVELGTLHAHCVSGQRQPSPSELMGSMKRPSNDVPQIFIVLDALDECRKRAALMQTLTHITTWDVPGLHLLMTNRQERDIEDTLSRLLRPQSVIGLQRHFVDTNIEQ